MEGVILKKILFLLLLMPNIVFAQSYWLPSSVILDDEITSDMIADNAITTDKITDGAITASKLASGATSSDLPVGGTTNCMVAVSGSTATISGDGGVALSATNLCRIGIKSDTTGESDTVSFSSNVSININGNLFGITDANWASPMPLIISVTTNGTTPLFGVSRAPLMKTGNLVTTLCDGNDYDCDAQADMMLTGTPTLSEYVNKPVTQVAWITGTYATSGSAWTLGLANASAGFNDEYQNVKFTMPVGQNGGIESTHFYVAGGDASGDVPKWATNQGYYSYWLKPDGFVIDFSTVNSGNCTNGDVASALFLALPYIPTNAEGGGLTGSEFRVLLGGEVWFGGTQYQGGLSPDITSTLAYVKAHPQSGVNANSFSNVNNQMEFYMKFNAFQ